MSHSTGKAKAKQIAASASANSALRLHEGRSGRKSGRFTIGIGSGLCDAVDKTIKRNADHENDHPANDRRGRTAAEIKVEESVNVGIEAEQFSRAAGAASRERPHNIEGAEGVDGAD